MKDKLPKTGEEIESLRIALALVGIGVSSQTTLKRFNKKASNLISKMLFRFNTMSIKDITQLLSPKKTQKKKYN